MNSWTEKLLALQNVQIRMATMQQTVDRMPQEKKKAEEQYAAEAAALKAAQDDLKACELKIRALDSQIESARAKKKDFQAKSSIIKSNDEYRAALVQIEMCSQAIGALEDEQLALLEAIEGRKKTVAERQQALKAAKERAAVVIADIETRGKDIQGKLSAMSAQAAELQSGIDPSWLAAYRRLRGATLIKATQPVLVRVDGESCGACRMHVPPQKISDAMAGRLTFCPSCQAMLYWED